MAVSEIVGGSSVSSSTETLELESLLDSPPNVNELSFCSLTEGLESEHMGHSTSRSDGISSISVAVTETPKTLLSSSSSTLVEAQGNQQSWIPQSSIITDAWPVTIMGPAFGDTLGGSWPSSHKPSKLSSDIGAPADVGSSGHKPVVPSDGSGSSMTSVMEVPHKTAPSENGGGSGDDPRSSPMHIESQNCHSSQLSWMAANKNVEEEETCGLGPPIYDDYDSPKSGDIYNKHSNHCPTLGEWSNQSLESPYTQRNQWNWPSGEDREHRRSSGQDREDRIYRSSQWGDWNTNWLQNRADQEDRHLWNAATTGVGAGLENLGNTCFVNTILQCFTHTVPLVKALRSINHIMPCESEGFCVLCFLREHIELAIASSGKIIAPLKLVDNLNKISSDFVRSQQEDAHEFLQCFLNKFEGCLDSRSTGDFLSSQDDNIVKRVFGGRSISKLQCCNCGHRSDTYEPLIGLSLEIDDVDTLECALQSFTRVEKMDEKKYTCENCKEKVSTEKQLMLEKVPLVAALHLKLFKGDGQSSFQKINKHVEFPLQLDFKPFTNGTQDDEELRYQLYAIVVHRGCNLYSGHYFSYIRSSPDTWHAFNDERVTKVQEEIVLSTDAYILFYVKEGTPWFSSLMESQILSGDPSVSNASPKSVLDNVDPFIRIENSGMHKAEVSEDAAEGTSAQFSYVTRPDKFQMIETREGTERASADCIYGSKENRLHLPHNASSGDIPMVDVFVQPGESDCKHGSLHDNLGALPFAKENNANQVSGKNGRRGHQPSPPSSLNQEMNLKTQPESRSQIPRSHLKVKAGSKVNCKIPTRKAIKDKDSLQKREACRYLQSMPRARGLTLMAAMHSQDGQRRLRSSPCKRVSLSSSCRQLFNRH